MFNFSLMIDQATELFHSANIGELMNDEAPADLQDALDQAGISSESLQNLAPEEALSMLQENGIDLGSLGDGEALTQIREMIGR